MNTKEEINAKDDQTPSDKAVVVPRLVGLMYDGVKWTAQRLKNSRCHVHFKNTEDESDGMMWSAPTLEMSDLDWRIRHHPDYQPTREELLCMLGVIDSFHALLQKPPKKQRAIAKVLKEIISRRE